MKAPPLKHLAKSGPTGFVSEGRIAFRDTGHRKAQGKPFLLEPAADRAEVTLGASESQHCAGLILSQILQSLSHQPLGTLGGVPWSQVPFHHEVTFESARLGDVEQFGQVDFVGLAVSGHHRGLNVTHAMSVLEHGGQTPIIKVGIPATEGGGENGLSKKAQIAHFLDPPDDEERILIEKVVILKIDEEFFRRPILPKPP